MYMQAKRHERKYIMLAGHDQVPEKGKRFTGKRSEEKRGSEGKEGKEGKRENREEREWNDAMDFLNHLD